MKKRFVFIMFFMLAFNLLLFANGGGGEVVGTSGTADARMYYLPRNVANNSNVMIELSQHKNLGKNDFSSNFDNNSEGNLSIFRLRASLFSGTRSVYNRTYVSNGILSDGNSNTNSPVVTISSPNGWKFVNEDNYNETRSFSLNAVCTENRFVVRTQGNRITINYEDDRTIDLTSSSSLPLSGVSSYFRKNGNVYQMNIPTCGYVVVGNSNIYYPQYGRFYDICISLDDDVTGLEPGYYTTELQVTSTVYHEYEGTIGQIRLAREGALQLSQTITVRGFIGINPQSGEGSYTFTVLSADDTYTMDLGLDLQTGGSKYYNIARVIFEHMSIINYNPASQLQTKKNKFKMYISPSNDYNAGGTYQFIRMNTESQLRTDRNTVYYDLYIKDENGMYRPFNYFNGGGFSDNNPSIGGAGNGPVSTTNKLLPHYESLWISAGASGVSAEYRERWNLDQNIYLRITDASLAAMADSSKIHQSGIYYSYIYFTLVAD